MVQRLPASLSSQYFQEYNGAAVSGKSCAFSCPRTGICGQRQQNR